MKKFCLFLSHLAVVIGMLWDTPSAIAAMKQGIDDQDTQELVAYMRQSPHEAEGFIERALKDQYMKKRINHRPFTGPVDDFPLKNYEAIVALCREDWADEYELYTPAVRINAAFNMAKILAMRGIYPVTPVAPSLATLGAYRDEVMQQLKEVPDLEGVTPARRYHSHLWQAVIQMDGYRKGIWGLAGAGDLDEAWACLNTAQGLQEAYGLSKTVYLWKSLILSENGLRPLGVPLGQDPEAYHKAEAVKLLNIYRGITPRVVPPVLDPRVRAIPVPIRSHVDYKNDHEVGDLEDRARIALQGWNIPGGLGLGALPFGGGFPPPPPGGDNDYSDSDDGDAGGGDEGLAQLWQAPLAPMVDENEVLAENAFMNGGEEVLQQFVAEEDRALEGEEGVPLVVAEPFEQVADVEAHADDAEEDPSLFLKRKREIGSDTEEEAPVVSKPKQKAKARRVIESDASEDEEAALLPSPRQKPIWISKDQRDKRDAEIVRLHQEENLSYAQISDTLKPQFPNMTKRLVFEVLKNAGLTSALAVPRLSAEELGPKKAKVIELYQEAQRNKVKSFYQSIVKETGLSRKQVERTILEFRKEQGLVASSSARARTEQEKEAKRKPILDLYRQQQEEGEIDIPSIAEATGQTVGYISRVVNEAVKVGDIDRFLKRLTEDQESLLKDFITEHAHKSNQVIATLFNEEHFEGKEVVMEWRVKKVRAALKKK